MQRVGLPPQLKEGCVLFIPGDTVNTAKRISDVSLYNDANLVRYYTMDDLTEKNGNTLTNNGCTATTGKFGGAYSSNGTKDMVDVTSNGITNGACTLSGWVYVSGTHARSDHPFVISTGDNSTDIVYVIGFNQTNTKIVFSRLKQLIAWQDATYSFTPTVNTWYHLALTYDGATIKGYLNGAQVTSVSASGNGSGTTVNGVILLSGFNGGVDDVSIFNRVLSNSEILSIAGNNIAIDASGNSNHGTPVNSPTPTRGGLHGYKGLKFNGTSQSVTLPNVTGVRSFTASILPTANNRTILNLGGGNTITLNASNQIATAGLTGVSISSNGSTVNSVNLNQWNVITVSFDSVNLSSASLANSSFVGTMANVLLNNVPVSFDNHRNARGAFFIP